MPLQESKREEKRLPVKCHGCGWEGEVARTTARRMRDSGRCGHCPRIAKGASKAPRGAIRKPYVQLSDEQMSDIWLLRNGDEAGASVARRYGVSESRVSEIWKRARKCEGGCGRLTTTKHGRCKSCAKPRRPSPLTDEQREQIVALRGRGMTYEAIAQQLDVSVAKVRKALDPGFQGKRTCTDGIIRIEHRNGQVTYHAHVTFPGSKRSTSIGPYDTHEQAENGRREWKAARLGVGKRTPRKATPDLRDVYGNVRLALSNLNAADVPTLQARRIFAALHEAEDLIREALRDDYSGRFKRRAA